MSVVEGLQAARARISDPEHWWDGKHTDKMEVECALTAINMGGYEPMVRALAFAIDGVESEALGDAGTKVIGFNDSHTHTEVLALYDKAIETEKARVGKC